MEVLTTILYIVAFLVIAPLLAFAWIAVLGGAILGLIFLLAIILMGAEPTMTGAITCILVGIGIACMIGFSQIMEEYKRKKED